MEPSPLLPTAPTAKMVSHPLAWVLFAVVLFAIPVAAQLSMRTQPSLPDLGAVPSFSFTDQRGRTVSSESLRGSVWVADFIFTSCSEACPRLTGEMARLQSALDAKRSAGQVKLVSISVDPARDTKERLAEFAARYQAHDDRWYFVRGAEKEVEDAVVHGFKMSLSKEPDPQKLDGFNILHGTRFVLVDQKGHLRGYYDVAAPDEIATLQRDVLALAERGSR
jgi:protein SCO1/2